MVYPIALPPPLRLKGAEAPAAMDSSPRGLCITQGQADGGRWRAISWGHYGYVMICVDYTYIIMYMYIYIYIHNYVSMYVCMLCYVMLYYVML